jgi:PAS domain S-box-containing protein
MGVTVAKKILIVDDDLSTRKTLFDILKAEGYKPFGANNGAEGLVFLKQFSANLVIIDLRLADMSGLELLSRVKSDNPSIDAIILAENASLESAIEATNKGTFSYLLKPYDMDQLLLHIRRALEKQQARDALIESEERYRIAIEHSNDGVAIVRGDNLVFVNKKLLDIFGYDQTGEVVGQPISVTVHPDDRERVLGYSRRRQRNESAPSLYEMKGIKKDGETVDIEVSATNTVFDGKPASLAYLRDITERKQKERDFFKLMENIRQEKLEWESLVDSLSELVLLLDENGHIIRSNPGAGSWSLQHPGDTRRQTPHDVLHPYCTKFDCYLRDFISKGLKASAVGRPAELEVKDEALKRYLDIRMRPIRTQQKEASMSKPDTRNNEANRIGGSFAVLVIHDITDRRQAKESLAEAYGELKETQQELIRIEKLALLGSFSSGIAHEIRNPLANIRASAQFCLAQYELDEEIKKHLRIMLRNSDHANKIIKDLIDLAKPSEVSLKPGNTNDVINRVCDLVKTRCEKQQILLHKRASRRLPTILMDEERMEKAFLNFVLNALDAMPKGGKLTINTYPHFDENKIIVTIQDTGKGIPQEDLDNIFHPFFTTKRTGIGLGLCLADQVINSHKGRLSVTSGTGEGTTITIELPIARER